tara:strand:+ start:908 stop:1402 length:495 start_codon:yes stop_codon:yes gene_type:complete
MKTLILTLSMIITASLNVTAGNYRLNEAKIDRVFEQSEFVDLSLILYSQEAFETAVASAEDEKQMIAGIVAIASFVVRFGSFPVAIIPVIGSVIYLGIWVAAIVPWHRLVVLGTGDGALKITALYCVTLGWCINAHHVVDGIFLLIEEDKTRFVDNSKYVMWAN